MEQRRDKGFDPAAEATSGPAGATSAPARRGGVDTATKIGVGAIALGAAWALWKGLQEELDLRGRVALVTGGSRGLGLRLAEELGRQGARVVIAARGVEGLALAAERLVAQGIEVEPLAVDLMHRDEAEALPSRVVERMGRLDVVINNAGEILVAPFEEQTVEDYERSLALHFWAPMHVSRAALPYLRQSGEGRIVNVTSIGGQVPVPHLAAYCVGKFAAVALSQCMQAELTGKGVRVTTVSPALMRTGSFVHAEFRGQQEREVSWFGVASSAPGLTIDAGAAARRIVAACRRGDAILNFNWSSKLGVRMQGTAPGLTQWLLAGAASLLPAPAAEPTPREPAYDHPSPLVPSVLTKLGDRAAVENLELVGEAARYPVERP